MSRFTDGMTTMRARADAVRKLVNDLDALEVLAASPSPSARLDVLRMMQGSLSLHEISVELYLSANTVKSHARAAYRKLGAHSRADAVRLARGQSLI